MYLPYSLLASAIVLSFSTPSIALSTADYSDANLSPAADRQDFDVQDILQRWPLNKVFGKRQIEVEAAVDEPCPTDDMYIEILDAGPSTAVQQLCNNLLDIPPATVTVSLNATV